MLTTRQTIALSLLSIAISTAIVALVHLPDLNALERANGYPYGRMCNSIFTGYVNTCR